MPIPVTSQHVTGFVVGLGVAAAGFYFYKKNQRQVDEWLRQQGISIDSGGGLEYSAMTLEELVREKERLEDLIAEREHAATQEAARPRARAQRKRPATQTRKRETAKAAA